MDSQEFIERKFSDYYRESGSNVCVPTSIEKREFGFLVFKRGMLRHLSFETKEALESFLRGTACSDVYRSCSYYENPRAEMDRKGWSGADLVFDVDADHIPTSCGRLHDSWVCGSCRFPGKGVTPKKCPVCGSEKFKVSTWPCEVCLDSAKTETTKLLDMLMQDFGFSEKEVDVFFSGHRGYHAHVEGEVVRTLNAAARKEIVDYVSGLGLDFSLHGFDEKRWKRRRLSNSPPLRDFGWWKRLSRGTQVFIRNAKEEDLSEIGIKGKVAKILLRHKNTDPKGWSETRFWEVKGVGPGTWRKIAEHTAKLQSARIDTVVTIDIHRLIRLAGTLHGKTGLRKVGFPVSFINDFDPFKSAVAFRKGAATINVSEAPEFMLADEVFGPYKNQKVELPTAPAVLLICKGRAEVLD